MIFTESCNVCHIVQTQIFRTVLLNIIAHGHEFFRVFFLFVGSHIKGISFAGIFPADQHQHFKQLRVDRSADQDGTAVIFPVDI